ncbi:branched-chain amino acid ABC transporter permease [Salicibibacter kimchii]|uniref:Branched-chain amino acid ABC transporter permease n=1 Tax=Salicibibacter kimchii TaxID=2099786 RepID=A0A345BWS0_9BACI|nr:branched-chain amino acid ABC transporter permease [Salicibibacter kimchii]AXF55401.1 branched-chain amino acid ABC transporter permease [Salicibibacter kimchii]
MDVLAQQLFNGLTIGSVYSLVALGLTLVYGILHVPNFAHGALYMVGGYATLMSMTLLGMPYFVAMLAAVLVVGGIGVLMERLVFNQLRDSPPIHDKIAAIGLLLFLETLIRVIWGADYRSMTTPFSENIVSLLGITVTSQRILIVVAAIIAMIVLQLFLKKTMVGASIIAMSQDREGAFLQGINANRVAMLTFFISGGLAAFAAAINAPINLVYPDMGHLVILKAFVIVIIGGMGSVPGAILGGYILGFSESLGATFISAEYSDIIAFVLLVIILTVKPQGLFAKGAH